MEKSTGSQPKASHGVEDNLNDEIKDLLSTLPKEKSFDSTYLYQYQGFWYRPDFFTGMISSQWHFQARDSDILLITYPKSGTTWLKSLTYATVHRSHSAFEHSPILTTSPHRLVPFVEVHFSLKNNDLPSIEHLSTPRIFGTHIPFSSLPPSIGNSNCRIVYMCRNPLDQFISHWCFSSKVAHDRNKEPLSLEEAFERVCSGIQNGGPFWEHVLGYWKASLENPDKILFLKYEDLQDNTYLYVKKLAEFIGYPISDDEEKLGVIEEIVKLCSFENMKDLEVNKSSSETIFDRGPKNSDFFREGKVGDWTNYLSVSMSERLKSLIEDEFFGTGLTFRYESPM